MTTQTRPNKANALARNQRVSAALAKHFTRSATINLGGTSYKVSDLQQMITDQNDAVTAADAVRAQWQTAVADANQKIDAVATMTIALRQHVLSEYGSKSQVAVDFNFAPKRKSPTAQTTAAAVQKRRAKSAAKKAALADAMAKLDGTTPPTLPPAPAVAVTPKPTP